MKLLLGDCLEVMPTLEADSVDAIITDPPYGLSFMGKHWDRGVPGVDFWVEALRVAKPGCHLLAFGGTRTFHRLTCAIEDAGWEIRDCVMWVYGSGFPKSLDVSKAIDKAAGIERPRVVGTMGTNNTQSRGEYKCGEAISGEAIKWQGWGTALKPAWEPIILARKPIEGTVAANVQKYGTGAMNIDGSRVKWAGTKDAAAAAAAVSFTNSMKRGTVAPPTSLPTIYNKPPYEPEKMTGRFPANLIHDGSEEVVENFPQSKSDGGCKPGGQSIGGRGKYNGGDNRGYFNLGDSGSASRFFYCAKASKADRDDGCEFLPLGEPPASARSKPGEGRQNALGNPRSNHHPTVKPTALMRYLCRLITPPQGIVLDPFMGSGSTGKAAILEGFDFIGIELEPQYLEIAEARINAATKQLQMVVD